MPYSFSNIKVSTSLLETIKTYMQHLQKGEADHKLLDNLAVGTVYSITFLYNKMPVDDVLAILHLVYRIVRDTRGTCHCDINVRGINLVGLTCCIRHHYVLQRNCVCTR